MPARPRIARTALASLALALAVCPLIGGCPFQVPVTLLESPQAVVDEPRDLALVEEDPASNDAVLALAEEEQITRIEIDDGEAELYPTDMAPNDPLRILPVIITAPTVDLVVKLDTGLVWMEGEPGAPFIVQDFIYNGPLDPFDADLFAAGDIDGDLDADVFISRTDLTNPPTFPSTFVAYANANGEFTPGPTLNLPGMGEVRSVSAGDVNNDNRADVLIVGSNASRILVSFGDGSFRFLDTSTGALSTTPTAPLPGAHVGVLERFDGDTGADAILTPSIGGVSVHLNGGSGVFQPPVSQPGIFAFHIVVDDFDGDGLNDATVAGHSPGVISVYPGAPGGGLLPPINLDATNTPIRLGAIHLTGDDLPDLFTVDRNNNAIQASFNTDEGWQTADRTPFVNQTNRALVVRDALFIDIDADGHQDLVGGDAGGHLFFSLNAGDGSGDLLPPRSSRISLVIDDVRSVGVLAGQGADLRPAVLAAASNFTSSNLYRLDTSVSPPVWEFLQFIDLTNASTDVAVADMNGDTRSDLVYAHSAGSVTVLTQSALGVFENPQNFPTPGGSWSAIATLDLDGANAPDLALIDAASGSIRLFTSAAGGGFTAGPTYAAPPPLSGNITTADLTADGRDDVIIGAGPTGGDAGSVRVFPNQIGGTLGAPFIVPLAQRPVYVTAADVDDDGRSDVVASTERPSTGHDGAIAVVLNSPTGIGAIFPAYHYASGNGVWVGLADLRSAESPRARARGTSSVRAGSRTAIAFGSISGFPVEPMTRLEPFDAQAPCPGDANGDRVVDFLDLNIVLSDFGLTGAPGALQGDLDNDGDCDFIDLNIVLSAFGAPC